MKSWLGPIACDTETYGKVWEEKRKLVGISLGATNEEVALYIPVWHYIEGSWQKVINDELQIAMSKMFKERTLVGHNFTYDKRWLVDSGFTTTWSADTRLMWHLSSAPAGPEKYGLKDAEKEVLGWPESNDVDLAKSVEARGGSLKDGDHYLADLEILAKYACLDAFATSRLYRSLSPFFDINSYWGLLSDMMAYNELLELNTYLGVAVNHRGLEVALKSMTEAKERHLKSFFKSVKSQVDELELDWADRKMSLYKREYNRENYLANPQKWKRFNLNSDSDKRELFYGKLKLPIIEKTEGGLPSCAADTLRRAGKNVAGMEEYLKYEKVNTLISNFAQPYLDSLGDDNRLHPGFNICGTVSYRLSGFKPYLLNAPFDEKEIMRHLQCDEGYVGVHADLSAIEPSLTAHYSEDESLLKVFRDGLGDIYLDLALNLFPNDQELKYGYDPLIPITSAVKHRFSKQRKIAKIIQLAVQYTGTGHTVCKSLSKDGHATSLYEAEHYVRQYWRKFRKVAEFNARLQEVNRYEGQLRNTIGRIIRVPNVDYKDLPNRFIQSSAHDVLILWVTKIYEMCKKENIEIRPMLIDCHDSTSNQVEGKHAERVKEIYQEALNDINKELNLSVTLRAEIKMFQTFAGLKGEE